MLDMSKVFPPTMFGCGSYSEFDIPNKNAAWCEFSQDFAVKTDAYSSEAEYWSNEGI